MPDKKKAYKLVCEAYIKYATPEDKSLGDFMKKNRLLVDTIIMFS